MSIAAAYPSETATRSPAENLLGAPGHEAREQVPERQAMSQPSAATVRLSVAKMARMSRACAARASSTRFVVASISPCSSEVVPVQRLLSAGRTEAVRNVCRRLGGQLAVARDVLRARSTP